MDFEDLFCDIQEAQQPRRDEGASAELDIDHEHRTLLRLHLLERFTRNGGLFGQKLRADAEHILKSLGASWGKTDIPQKLAYELWKTGGYNVRVCSTAGSCVCLGNHQNTFLEVKCDADSGQRFLVDPGLRDNFEVAKPTPEYAALLERLPPVFVGDASMLKSLVGFMVDRMRESIESHGMAVPPWRTRPALLARWGFRSACSCKGGPKSKTAIKSITKTSQDEGEMSGSSSKSSMPSNESTTAGGDLWPQAGVKWTAPSNWTGPVHWGHVHVK
eukprot:jgi/Mesvir1/25119/Mv21580-RA.1